jgi:hypothetical protein
MEVSHCVHASPFASERVGVRNFPRQTRCQNALVVRLTFYADPGTEVRDLHRSSVDAGGSAAMSESERRGLSRREAMAGLAAAGRQAVDAAAEEARLGLHRPAGAGRARVTLLNLLGWSSSAT